MFDNTALGLPAPGVYDVTLHFAEPSFNSAGSRVFDIRLQSAVVPQVPGFDIFAAAGGTDTLTQRRLKTVAKLIAGRNSTTNTRPKSAPTRSTRPARWL